MKVTSPTFLLMALAVLALHRTADAQTGATPRNGACFYRDANYRGAYFCLQAGESMSTLASNFRGEISSIRVFGGVEVTTFDRSGYRGESRRLDSDAQNLSRNDWNDVIESIRVRPTGFGGGNGGRPSFGQNPDVVIRRAYQDVLGRDPDTPGLRLYRSRMIDDGWTEQQVRQALRDSPEYREKSTMTVPKAQEIVRMAYLNVLGREPDPASRTYVNRVLRDKWTQQDVERELRRSDEFRNNNRARPR